MMSLLQLLNEWEIQLLVLLSFILQVFLFFTGGFRQRSKSGLLRGTIWLAYLGADMVAVFALGFLSRHEGATMEMGSLGQSHPLAVLWAPFLLIHLGGQDTITAFSMEDNNLWLRHLLNMVVQTTLTLYIFWKSTSWHNVQLLIPSFLLFIAGLIKYVERTMALKFGQLSNIKENSNIIMLGYQGDKHYIGLVRQALRLARGLRELLAGCKIQDTIIGTIEHLASSTSDHVQFLDAELSIMYNDIYTKAALLRTKSGIVVRCISQISTIVAFVLFAVSNKQARYGRADVAITYTLFIGGFLLEVCAMFTMLMASPWTWMWMEKSGYRRLASMSRFLFSSNVVGWGAGTRPLWSNTMGQYSMMSYMGYEKPVNRLSQRAMVMIRKMGRSFIMADQEKNLLWMSKLLDSQNEVVDDEITECIFKEIRCFQRNDQQQQWQHLGPFLESVVPTFYLDFISSITLLHLHTEAYLCKLSAASSTGGVRHGAGLQWQYTTHLVDVCRKISNYMFYLVCVHPDMVQVSSGSIGAVLERYREGLLPEAISRDVLDKDTILGEFSGESLTIQVSDTDRNEETLEELRDMWVRILVYTAGKSRTEEHAAQLARGGELLTFVWLLMAHCNLGQSGSIRIELINQTFPDRGAFTRYAIDLLSPRSGQWEPAFNRDMDTIV